MWKNIVEAENPQMTIWRMRIACCIPKAKNTYSEYVILIAFQRQEWLRECASMLRYSYIVCLVLVLNLVVYRLRTWILSFNKTTWSDKVREKKTNEGLNCVAGILINSRVKTPSYLYLEFRFSGFYSPVFIGTSCRQFFCNFNNITDSSECLKQLFREVLCVVLPIGNNKE